MTSDRVVSDLMLPLWEEVLWPFLDAWDSSSSSFLKKESMVPRELVRLGPSIRPHGELLFFLMQKKPAFVPDSEAFNSFIWDGFLVPELKGGSEASEDDQTDNVSNEA